MQNSSANLGKSWVDEDLLPTQKRKEMKPNIFWVSEIVGPCLRSAYFHRKIGKPLSLEALRICNSGHVLESWWIELLRRRKDVSILSLNVPCWHVNPFYRIYGRADVLLQREHSKIEVHEIKTIKKFGSWLKKPKPEHINQLQFYLNVLGMESGFIDYISKEAFIRGNDLIDLRFPIQRDTEVYEILREKANELFGALMASVPPLKTNCWRCIGYCSYNKDCEKGHC